MGRHKSAPSKLSSLRVILARFARRARKLLEVLQIDELVRLPSQIIGGAFDRGDHSDTHAETLNRLNKRSEIAGAGKEDHVIDGIGVAGHGEHVDSDFDLHAALHTLAALIVGVFLDRLRVDDIAVVDHPVGQRANRTEFFGVIRHRRVIVGASEDAFIFKILDHLLVIEFEPDSFCGRIDIHTIDEYRNSFITPNNDRFVGRIL